MASTDQPHPTYSQFSCIGAGFSGIGLGATLKRWYDITDIQIFERYSRLGGTWHVNKYPGCACDIPSSLYSYSFERNPDWSRALPLSDEIWSYIDRVARKYSLVDKIDFGVSVERCEWIEETSRWRLYVRRCETDTVYVHESQFLFTGVGALDTPKDIDIPGAETFKGLIFHSSRWRQDVDIDGKNVVVVGNGCTGDQLVPAIVTRTKHLTHVVRSKQWILPPLESPRLRLLRKVSKWIPGGIVLHRFIFFCFAEAQYQTFLTTSSGTRYRRRLQAKVESYMRAAAPEKYHDLLIPDFEMGCKRRVYDSGYLQSLHADNLTLTDERILEIQPDGIRTDRGFIPADTIVLANGFKTSRFLPGLEIAGRGGKTLAEHWDGFGGAEAYNCCACSGFPNLFMILGPNTITGHNSTIMAAENGINYALRVIKPVLDGRASVVDVRPEAEVRFVEQLHRKLRETVWSSGCRSWYVDTDAKTGGEWNAITYPYSQVHYWYKCLFPVWRDWRFSGPAARKTGLISRKVTVLASSLLIGALVLWRRGSGNPAILFLKVKQTLECWLH